MTTELFSSPFPLILTNPVPPSSVPLYFQGMQTIIFLILYFNFAHIYAPACKNHSKLLDEAVNSIDGV
jgi:hypothetical protein